MTATLDFLAIDMGASSGRITLVRFDGKRIALQEMHRFQNQPVEVQGELRWDIERILDEIRQGLQIAQKTSGNIVSLGCDSWALDHGFLNSQGELLEFPYSYRDQRTRNVLKEIHPLIPLDMIYRHTAAPMIEFSTLGQLYMTRKMRMELLQQTDQFRFMPDLIHHFLCGESQAEKCLASTSQLFSWEHQQWDEEIIEKLNLPMRIFPEVLPPGSKVGRISPAIQEQCGLPNWEIRLPACHDTASAVAATPLQSENDLILSSGSWSMLGLLVDQPVISETAMNMGAGTYAVPGGWVFMQGIMGLWHLERFQREEQTAPISVLIQELQKETAFHCLFNPSHALFQRRMKFREALNEWCRLTGQNPPSSARAVARCILESLALFYRQSVENLSRLTERRIECVRVVGGGAKNHLLNQWLANATNLPVSISVPEAAVSGNALVQAVGRGDLSSFGDIRRIVQATWPETTFFPRDQRQWAEAYLQYQAISSQISPDQMGGTDA